MHYRMGSDSAPDRTAAMRGLLADDPDLAEVLGGRETRRNSRSGSSLAHSRARGSFAVCISVWISAMTIVIIKEIVQIANGSLEDRGNKSEIVTGSHNPYVDVTTRAGYRRRAR